jgi:hypothetical protein
MRGASPFREEHTDLLKKENREVLVALPGLQSRVEKKLTKMRQRQSSTQSAK